MTQHTLGKNSFIVSLSFQRERGQRRMTATIQNQLLLLSQVENPRLEIQSSILQFFFHYLDMLENRFHLARSTLSLGAVLLRRPVVGRPENVSQQIGAVSLEARVVINDLFRREGHRSVEGILEAEDGLNLGEAVEVELAVEGVELLHLEVAEYDLGGEFFLVLDDELVSVEGPGGDGRIAGVDDFI